MYNVIIEFKAEQDFESILLYITKTLKSPDAAKRLYQKIKEELTKLSSMPNRCSLVTEEPYSQLGVRKLFIEKYVAFYLVDESAKEVHVLRILYNRREWHNLI